MFIACCMGWLCWFGCFHLGSCAVITVRAGVIWKVNLARGPRWCFQISLWAPCLSALLSFLFLVIEEIRFFVLQSFLLCLFCQLLHPHVLWHTLLFCVFCKWVVGGGGLIRFLWGQEQLFGSYWEAHGVWLSLMLWEAVNSQCLNPFIESCKMVKF